jgi:uncharacterized membrane protein YhaH (DUF805 family)
MRYLLRFKGRASRAEWWAVNLAGFLPYIVLFLVLPKGYEPGVAISALFAAVLLFMSYLWIACSVRRLHDRGKHGAWFFLYFLPIVGSMWMLIECGILGSVASDRYGLTPRMLREIFD